MRLRLHLSAAQARAAAGRWGARLVALGLTGGVAVGEDRPAGAVDFRKDVEPMLVEFCYDCHGDGAAKGKVSFDNLQPEDVTKNRALWLKVLKNVRSGLMPPEKKPQPLPADKLALANWIKADVFGSDPNNPDPGRVTVRRLNRAEYRNTIRDLMGVEFNAEVEFPPDDTGFGFDNNGDVLTISPMLLEKYLNAARSIVLKFVPQVSGLPPENVIPGRDFIPDQADGANVAGSNQQSALSYYQPASVSKTVTAAHDGRYRLLVDLTAVEKFVDNQFDYNKCSLVLKVDGEELLKKEFVREGGKSFHYEFDRDWPAGEHQVTFALEPVLPASEQVRSLALRIEAVTVRGPMDQQHFVRPKNYERFFPKAVPQTAAERTEYARELLGDFARRAFRAPVDPETVDRLAALAEGISSQPRGTFESGVAQAMVAVLASPRFLFREEATEPQPAEQAYPLLDENALASRLSYFLWSSMPDAELRQLAEEKKLRANLPAQIQRMLADSRAEALTQNFTGQWLQARDIETVPIQARAVLARDEGTGGGGGGGGAEGRRSGNRQRAQFDGDLRKAMRQETERFFGYIVRDDRPVTELLESNYTFLNERLASHYGLAELNVNGPEMRRVTLPADSPRGGILTQGTVLAVTSNPDRTSPVKRGVFILDNILGAPAPPPPPDIPALEEAVKQISGHTPTLRETLAVHREKAECSSCHNRMDPLGLALENFNALGMWRTQELQQPIEVAGKLITGESFTNVQTLKHILATEHYRDFYRTLTEKLLTYALGRGLEYYDVQTVDTIVERLERENGRFSALLMGIVESAPFQKSRQVHAPGGRAPANQSNLRAALTPTP